MDEKQSNDTPEEFCNRPDKAVCPWKQWGNSVVAINVKYWKCSYCGHLIKDGVPFHIIRLNDSSTPFIFDKEFCLIMQIKKLEAASQPDD